MSCPSYSRSQSLSTTVLLFGILRDARKKESLKRHPHPQLSQVLMLKPDLGSPEPREGYQAPLGPETLGTSQSNGDQGQGL